MFLKADATLDLIGLALLPLAWTTPQSWKYKEHERKHEVGIFQLKKKKVYEKSSIKKKNKPLKEM